jgi:hypothetical protein
MTYTRLHKEKHRKKKRNASFLFHKNHIKTAHEAHFDKICAEIEKVSFLTFIRTSCSEKLISNYLGKRDNNVEDDYLVFIQVKQDLVFYCTLIVDICLF